MKWSWILLWSGLTSCKTCCNMSNRRNTGNDCMYCPYVSWLCITNNICIPVGFYHIKVLFNGLLKGKVKVHAILISCIVISCTNIQK